MLLVSVLWSEENRDGIMQICRLTTKYISLAVGGVALVFFVAAPCRITAKGDDLILRVRDDCELFNVREKGDAWKENPDDRTANLGIRMTMAAAKGLKYVNTLGTNTLLITI